MIGNFLAKAVGATALGLVGYDTFKTTKIQAAREAKLSQIQRIEDTYMRTDTLDGESHIANGLQNWSRRWHLGDNWLFKAKDNVCSYVSNFIGNIASNITTIGLGTVALLCGKGKFSPIKVPYVGKLAALLLAGKAGFYVLRDLFGIGAVSDRDKYNLM